MIRFSFSAVLVAALIVLIPSCSGGKSSGTGSSSAPPYDGVYFDTLSASPFVYTWGQVRDADLSWLESTADRIRECNQGLYKATEGYLRLGTQELSDKATQANIIIENLNQWQIEGGSAAKCWTQYYGPDRSYYIILCGNFQPDIFLHEVCHGQFDKQIEEYSCSICVMGTYMRPRNPELMHFCDSSDCQVSGAARDCWNNFILVENPSWNHTGSNPGTAPVCNVIITDN